MDEQQTPSSDRRDDGQHDEQPATEASTSAVTESSAPPARSRRGRRVVAAIAATAVVAGVAGVGGYGVGQRAARETTTTGGIAATGGSASGGDGLVPIPGNNHWEWPGSSGGLSDGGQSDQGGLPADPFGPGFPGAAPGSGGSGTSGTADSTTATASQLSGLVRIVSTMKYAGAKGAGTGMVLSADGEVVTNHHVVEGATSVRATVMTTGRTYAATVVGTDARDDVAVLRLTGASGLSTVTTDTDGASVGDAVTNVGDANGDARRFSAAAGKVLALAQSITTRSEGTATGERLSGLMKVSSDVVSGDSGGATYDAQGEVVGMTTAASSGSRDIVGYAVPITKVLRVVRDLDGGVTASRYDYGYPAFLGVGLGHTGATVQGVYRGTPAAGAGLAAGDRVTAFGTTSVRSAAQLQRAVARYDVGDRVRVTWTDEDGASHTATVTLARGPVV